jgi:hypothetical protein
VVENLQLPLDPGSYYIGLHANLEPLVTCEMFWAASNGGEGAETPGWSLFTVSPGTFEPTGVDFAFRISGTIVPEPVTTSSVLFLAVLVGVRRRS